MYFYYFLLRSYQRTYQKTKCILVFLSGLIPAWVGIAVLRSYSTLLFHLLLFALGWVSWTFGEYMLHRFWMHNKNGTQSAVAKTHHHHHTHPTEIVITGPQRILMLLVVALMVFMASRANNHFTFVAGLVAGLAGYFLMHKLLHHKLSQKLFRRLSRYHIYHHCKYSNTCFGITVTWWDDLFGTVPKNPKISDRAVEFYFNEEHHAQSGAITPNPYQGKAAS